MEHALQQKFLPINVITNANTFDTIIYFTTQAQDTGLYMMLQNLPIDGYILTYIPSNDTTTFNSQVNKVIESLAKIIGTKIPTQKNRKVR